MQKRGYHDFSFKIFCLTVPKNFVGEHFGVSKNFGYRKILCIREGGITFLRRKLLSHSTKKIRWGTLRCFIKSRVLQNFMHKKGISLNSVEKFLSHSADKIRRKILLCFERILVSKIFKQRRGKLLGFDEIFFISQDRKNFAREPFCVSENFWQGKKIMDKRGHITIFSRNFYVSQCRKISLRNPTVSLISGIKKC